MKNIKKTYLISIILALLFTGLVTFSILGKEKKEINNLTQFSSLIANVQFDYPSDLSLEVSEGKEAVLLKHKISFNGGYCADERGVVTISKTSNDTLFDDVSLEVRIVNSSLVEIFPNLEKEISPNEFGDASLTKVKIVNKEGYYAYRAFEMCGTIDYYFPLSSGTLIVRKNAEIVAVRNSGDLKEVLDSLTDEEVEKIFEMIVDTAKPIK